MHIHLIVAAQTHSARPELTNVCLWTILSLSLQFVVSCTLAPQVSFFSKFSKAEQVEGEWSGETTP